MIFYFLISIVFISELIIAVTVIMHLAKWDKLFISCNEFLNESKDDIKSIMQTGRKLSEQLTELVPLWINSLKSVAEKIILDQLKTLLTGIIFILVKNHVSRKFEK